MTTTDRLHLALLVRIAGDVAGVAQGVVMDSAIVGARSDRAADALRLAVHAAKAEAHESHEIAELMHCSRGMIHSVEHEIGRLPTRERMMLEAAAISVRALARDWLIASAQERRRSTPIASAQAGKPATPGHTPGSGPRRAA